MRGTVIALSADGDAFTATIPVTKDGFYRVELQGGPENKLVDASPQCTIDVLEDNAPDRVDFEARPRYGGVAHRRIRDRARADDDFGVRQLSFVTPVNGGPEQTKTLIDRARQGAARNFRRAHVLSAKS